MLFVRVEVHVGWEPPSTAFAAGGCIVVAFRRFCFCLLSNVLPSRFADIPARSTGQAAGPPTNNVNVGLGGCCDAIGSVHRGGLWRYPLAFTSSTSCEK